MVAPAQGQINYSANKVLALGPPGQAGGMAGAGERERVCSRSPAGVLLRLGRSSAGTALREHAARDPVHTGDQALKIQLPRESVPAVGVV